jgi:chromate transporter
LKIGSILYGSGYVLLSFLNTELIQTGYMTQAQVLDAFKIGQLTPGPVFTTATAIGYFSHGLYGALLATIGIFLPSFIFVSLIHPFKDLLKNNLNFKHFLEGVKIASLALILKVVVDLVLPLDLYEMLMVFVFLVLMVKTKINSTWLILGAGLFNLFISMN